MVNSASESFWQNQTDTYLEDHNYDIVCNDYAPSGADNGAARLLFQPDNQRPVLVVINGVENSPTHNQWEVLVNHGGYGDRDFSTEIAQWRSLIDSVEGAPQPPVLSGPRELPNGHFVFTFTGSASQTYRVEASTNFVDWDIILTNLTGNPNGRGVRDVNASAHRQRFYRVVQE